MIPVRLNANYKFKDNDTIICSFKELYDIVQNLINKKDVYSFNETKTDKVYVDSDGVKHDVYRKIINYTLTASSGYPTFSTGILNVDRMWISIERQYGSDNSQYISSNVAVNGYFEKSNGVYTFILSGSPSKEATKAEPGNYKFTFEYTKKN